ncbi:hypothetical protein IT568_12260, partial [bacterium]|nr:hypothetical protein [bacterium]
ERNNLNRLNNEKLDLWQANRNVENLEKLNALFVCWLNKIFTDEDDLFYVVVRRIQLKMLETLRQTSNETDEQIFQRIGLRLGKFDGDPIVTNDFSKVDEFSKELDYQEEKMNAKLRALR